MKNRRNVFLQFTNNVIESNIIKKLITMLCITESTIHIAQRGKGRINNNDILITITNMNNNNNKLNDDGKLITEGGNKLFTITNCSMSIS